MTLRHSTFRLTYTHVHSTQTHLHSDSLAYSDSLRSTQLLMRRLLALILTHCQTNTRSGPPIPIFTHIQAYECSVSHTQTHSHSDLLILRSISTHILSHSYCHFLSSSQLHHHRDVTKIAVWACQGGAAGGISRAPSRSDYRDIS